MNTIIDEKIAKESIPAEGTGNGLIDGHLLAKMAEGGADRLRSNADEVNKLNVFPVPDGDTGDNMSMTIESGVSAIKNSDSGDISEVIKNFAKGMLLGARGNSGVILSQFFAGTAKGLEGVARADAVTFGNALKIGVDRAYASVMTPTEGTILTVAREAVEYAVAHLTPKSTVRTLFSDLVKEMYASLQRTPEILAVLKEAGVIDSGGAGLFYIMDGFNRVLNGEKVEKTVVYSSETQKYVPTFSSFGADSVMEYGYCTEFLLQLQNSKTDVENFDIGIMTDFLSEVGDSIVAFKTDGIVKVHVHTMTPEKVLGFARRFGEFLTIKIENMSVQHSDSEKDGQKSEEKDAKAEPKKAKKQYGVVAVCNGSGVERLFLELGCDRLVSGGQTQNPSTQDFIDAFEKTSAEHIFVFPNNSNILMAAEQAASIYTDACIHVVPSKNLGMGYVAISSMDTSSSDPESIVQSMVESMSSVKTGFVSPSVRDANLNGIEIKNGEYIGFIDKEIKISLPDKTDAACALSDDILASRECFMLTVFFGKDTTGSEKDTLRAFLSENHPEIEAYYIDGEQDVYPYILVAE